MKIIKIGFSVECFTAALLQRSKTNIKICFLLDQLGTKHQIHDTILEEYIRDILKKHTAWKWYIVERVSGYSKVTSKKVCSSFMESLKSEL